jgi:hypothetical protein
MADNLPYHSAPLYASHPELVPRPWLGTVSESRTAEGCETVSPIKAGITLVPESYVALPLKSTQPHRPAWEGRGFNPAENKRAPSAS